MKSPLFERRCACSTLPTKMAQHSAVVSEFNDFLITKICCTTRFICYFVFFVKTFEILIVRYSKSLRGLAFARKMLWPAAVLIGLVFVLSLNWDVASPVSTPPATNEASPERRASFVAVGDIMLSRGVARVIQRQGDPQAPFRSVSTLLSSSDFNFGNLESPVSGDDSLLGKGFNFNTKKADVEGLVRNNFKIVSLANNHALDQKVAGLRFTRSFLSERGIDHVGAGENKDEAWQHMVITANGIRIGFVAASYTSFNDGGVAKSPYIARTEDLDHLKTAISRMKTETDLIIVSMHAGIEYTRQPELGQITFARAAIDAGADAVIGAHPHWIQTIEQYRGKYIFYSLGNFIFDQPWQDTKEGLAVRFSVYRNPEGRVSIAGLKLLPVVIETTGTPRPATASESAAILKKIGVHSSNLISSE